MESISRSTRVIDFRTVITSYIDYLLKQERSVPFALEQFNKLYDESKVALLKYTDEHSISKNDDEEIGTSSISYNIPYEKIEEYDRLYNNVQNIVTISGSLLETQFVDIVTQFDSFLQNLMRCIYKAHPEINKNSDKTITYKELFEHDSIESVKENIVEDILDELFRANHKKILEHLSKLTKVDVQKSMPTLFQQLIEITERRNIFIHCRGVVSGQYVRVCKENKVSIAVSEGDKLTIDIPYFKSSIGALILLSVNIGYIIWKKQAKADKAISDQFLLDVCDSLIRLGQNDVVISLIDMLYDNNDNEMHTVNKHLLKMYWIYAHKVLANTEKVNAGLSEDWTSVSTKITMILSILKGDVPAAITQMNHIGNDPNVIKKEAYSNVILFKDMVNTAQFQESFKTIYGEDFTYTRQPLK